MYLTKLKGEYSLLTGKNCVITGCLSGIGRSTLDLFAKAGANVIACALSSTEEYVDYLRELKQEYHVEIIPIYFNMMNNDEIKNAAREIQKHKKSIDVLVNIAGLNRDAIFQMVTMQDMQTTFQVDFFAQILFSQYIVKMMHRNGRGGSIINTSSISGLDGRAGQLSYASAKSAVVAATKSMAIELGPQKIRVNAIAPGMIDTEMYRNVPPEIIAAKVQSTQLKRMGKPEEVAKTILFLASDLSSHITGQVIRIDGGMGA